MREIRYKQKLPQIVFYTIVITLWCPMIHFMISESETAPLFASIGIPILLAIIFIILLIQTLIFNDEQGAG